MLPAPALWPVIAGISAFALTAGLIAYAMHPAKPMLHLDVTLSKQMCCSMQVWVNSTDVRDTTVLPMKPGTRTTYSLPVQTQFVHFFRLSPSDRSGAGETVSIHRIWTTRGDRVLDEVSAEEFRQFAVANAVVRPASSGVELVTTDRYPFLDSSAGLITDAGPRRLFFIELAANPLPAIAGVLLLGAALTFLFAVATWRHVLMIVGLGATLLFVRALPWVSSNLFELRDDVSEAVGNAPYAGIWKIRERAILEASALTALLLPALLAVAVWLKDRHRERPDDEPSVLNSPIGGLSLRAAIPLVAAPVMVLGLIGIPNLRDTIGVGRSVQYLPQWDANNFLFWRYLVRRQELEPMEDFFWPYGFQWIFEVGLPWGQLAQYAVYLSFWAWLSVGTYVTLSRFFGGRSLVLRYAGLMGFWLLLVLAGLVAFQTRYVGPVGVFLLYAGIQPHDRLSSPKRLIFAFALFELTLFELAQAVYALVPITFLAVVELVLDVRRTRPQLLRWLVSTLSTVFVPVVLALGVYAATGALGANIDYYTEFDALNSAYAYPADIDSWIADPRSIEAFVFWAVPLTIALGMLGLLMQRGPARTGQAIVAAAGILALMVMQKQVLRPLPPAAALVWQTTLFGLLLWAVLDSSLHWVRRWMGVAAVAGIAFAIILMSGNLRLGLETLRSGPERASATVDVVVNRRHEFTADARAEFEPARFVNFPEYAAVARELRRDPAVRAGSPVWVLGDDVPIVILIGGPWPYYYSELYDASAISFQEELISRLEETPPGRIVWNFRAPDFDSVPHIVRAPLVFNWTMRHFAPYKEMGSFAILRPLRPQEPVALDWWRNHLGPTIHLGHVPEASSVHGGTCSDVTRCETYLVVELADSAVPPPEVTVPVVVDGRRFEVRFATSPDSSRYVIRLERLWFWSSAPDGSKRRVETQDLDGMSATLVRRTIDPDSLY